MIYPPGINGHFSGSMLLPTLSLVLITIPPPPPPPHTHTHTQILQTYFGPEVRR